MSSILAELEDEGVLELWNAFKSGSLRDWSTNARVLSITGSPFFGHEGLFNPRGDDAKADVIEVVGTGGEHLSSGFTLFAHGRLNGGYDGQVFSKSDGTDANGGFNLWVTSGDLECTLFDGAAPSPTYTSTNPLDHFEEDSSVAVTWDGTTDAGSIALYESGIEVAGGEADFGSAPANNAILWAIGALNNGDSRLGGYYSDIVVVSRALTSTEIARLHAETMNRHWPSKPWRKAHVRLADPSESGIAGMWDMKPLGPVLPDLGANGNDGAINQANGVKSLLGHGLHFDGIAQDLNCGSDASLNLQNNFTIECWFCLNSDDDEGYLVAKTPSGLSDTGFSIYLDAAPGVEVIARYNGSNELNETPAFPVNRGKAYHLVTVIENGQASTYLDGELLSGPQDCTIPDNAAVDLTFANRPGGSSAAMMLDCTIYEVALYSEVKDTDWIAARYALGARAVQYASDWGAYESIATRGGTTGAYLENTGLQFGDATQRWRIIDDVISWEPAKSLYAYTGGYLYRTINSLGLGDTEALYGTWQFSFYKNGGGDEVNFVIGSDAVGAIFNGYYIQADNNGRLRLYERTGAAAATVIGTAAAAISLQYWYDVRVTRTFDGTFKMWYKLSSSDNWIYVGTADDTTHTSATYIQLAASSGSRIGWATLRGDHCILKYLGVVEP